MKKAVVIGATGLVGRHLIKRLLKEGFSIIAAARNVAKARKILDPKVDVIEMSETSSIFKVAIQESDAIINLAGAPIIGRLWTKSYKKKIYDSRVNTTRLLKKVIQEQDNKRQILINASAIGFYESLDKEQDETSPPGNNFLSRVCVDWENAAKEIEALGVRTVILRIGIVLAKDGGALNFMKMPYLIFLGGVPGNKNNHISWIHIDDLIEIIVNAIIDEKYRGIYNAVSPGYCTMEEFSNQLALRLRRPKWLNVPESFIKIFLGETASAVLSNMKIIPKRLKEQKFEFKYNNIDYALSSLLS